ncbi:hypothetical protein [Shewanella goraebulensis]|uniref:hypothetical protein n=1 Tax=Shewanella goraebulensis TaxID=3050637 RepID=UPI00254B2129|nr:hypothetical protein [Shewanella goraebulensis]
MSKLKQLVKGLLGKSAVSFNVDVMQPDLISGWACDAARPNHTCKIELKEGNVVVANCEANVMREDLLVAGIGSGNHGFSFDPGLSVFDVAPRKLDLYIDGKLQTSQNVTIRQQPDKILQEFGQEMEKRVDALLALHREKLTREMEQIVKVDKK